MALYPDTNALSDLSDLVQVRFPDDVQSATIAFEE